MPATIDTDRRVAHLETQVGALATQFKDFITESKESRERSERELTKLWEAVVKQGEDLRSGIERVGTKGQITWHMIFAAVGVIATVIAFAASATTSLIDGKIERLNDNLQDNRSEISSTYSQVEQSSLLRHEKQQSEITVITDRLNAFDAHIIKDAYNQGVVDAEISNLKKP